MTGEFAELDELVALLERCWPEPKPWLGAAGFRLHLPAWDGKLSPERTEVAGPSLTAALHDVAARSGSRPSLEFTCGTLLGRPPARFALPLEMDEVKERCDAGELLIGVAAEGAPRMSRLAAFPEVWEVTLELADGRREARPWSEWAAGLVALISLR